MEAIVWIRPNRKTRHPRSCERTGYGARRSWFSRHRVPALGQYERRAAGELAVGDGCDGLSDYCVHVRAREARVPTCDRPNRTTRHTRHRRVAFSVQVIAPRSVRRGSARPGRTVCQVACGQLGLIGTQPTEVGTLAGPSTARELCGERQPEISLVTRPS